MSESLPGVQALQFHACVQLCPLTATQAEAQAALAAAEADRSSRAEAQGMSEALRLESERRARVFNNAVKAAVGKVQRELEAERDELQVGAE